PEIAAQMKKPPAVSKPKPLAGLGGWLALLGFGLVVGPIRFIFQLVSYYAGDEASLVWKQFPVALLSDLAFDLLLTILMIRALILFLGKAKTFPGFYLKLWITTLCIFPIKLVFDAIIMSAYSGGTVGELIVSGFQPKDWAPVVAAA